MRESERESARERARARAREREKERALVGTAVSEFSNVMNEFSLVGTAAQHTKEYLAPGRGQISEKCKVWKALQRAYSQN